VLIIYHHLHPFIANRFDSVCAYRPSRLAVEVDSFAKDSV